MDLGWVWALEGARGTAVRWDPAFPMPASLPLAQAENNSCDKRGNSIAHSLLPLTPGRKQPALSSFSLLSASSSAGLPARQEVVSAEPVQF